MRLNEVQTINITNIKTDLVKKIHQITEKITFTNLGDDTQHLQTGPN